MVCSHLGLAARASSLQQSLLLPALEQAFELRFVRDEPTDAEAGLAGCLGKKSASREHVEARIDRILDTWKDAPTPLDLPPSNGPRPIFVVGMPRSGTTLVEAVLAAHPEVEAASGAVPA